MKAKTTSNIFFQKDFALSFLQKSFAHVYLLSVMLLSASVNAQVGEFRNGRNIITTQTQNNPTGQFVYDQPGLAPFSIGAKNARIQLLYLQADLVGNPVAGIGGQKISKIAFFVRTNISALPKNLSNVTIRMSNEDRYSFPNTQDGKKIPHKDLGGFVEVFNGPYSIPPMSGISSTSEARWIEFPFHTAFQTNATDAVVVEISYTYASDSFPGSLIRLACSATSSLDDFMSRGCFSNNNSFAAIDLYSAGAGANVLPAQENGSQLRKQRPWTKFTFEANQSNSIHMYYENTTSGCLGDDITITAKNMYATGYTHYLWEVSNAPDTGFSSYTGPYNALLPVLTIKQPLEKRYFRMRPQWPGNGPTGAEVSEIKGVNTYEDGAWTDGPPIDGESIYFRSNLTTQSWSEMQDVLDVCSINVAYGITLTVPSGKTIKTNRILKTGGILGNIIFDNNASLLQTTSLPNEAVNITFKRSSSPVNRFDYTYFSSPVTGAILNEVSPLTLSDKYLSLIDGAWAYPAASSAMEVGRGYAIRAPQPFSLIGPKEVFTAIFRGKPNNGTIASPISAIPNTFNLVGNPYPSAVNVGKFVRANTFLDGTIYLWTQAHGVSFFPETNGYSYNTNNYIAKNNLGSTDGLSDYNVAAGQSFMVENVTAGPSNGAIWTNDMRIDNSAGSTTEFFKVENGAAHSQEIIAAEPAGRFWLELQGNNGGMQRVLVGYIQGATEGYDRMYDAKQMQAGSLGLYTIAQDQQKLGIMANGLPFSHESSIALGYSTTAAGYLTIGKFLEDGFIQDVEVYLNDRLTSTLHSLSQAPYTFNSTAGTFDDRFIIVFKPKVLQNLNQSVQPNKVVVFDRDNALQFRSLKEKIGKVIVYELSGRVLARMDNCNSIEVALSTVPRKNQFLVVEVYLINGEIETQKFRF